MASPVPEVLDHLVELNVDFQVLICLGDECRCAVSPGAIVRHMFLQHKTPIDLRRQLDQYIQEFLGSYDYATVQLPLDGSFPQANLEVVDGFQCKQCLFKTQDRSNIRKHANKEHGKQREKDQALFSVVRLQSWFKGKRERYWVVDENVRVTPPNPAPGEGAQEGPVVSYEQLESEIQQWKADAKERRLTILSRPAAVELDPWIRYTKWFEVLGKSKHNLVRTYAFLRVPDLEEEGLELVVRAWRQVKERCLDTLEATDHKDILKWWASPQQDHANQYPFELPQSSQSLDKYNQIWEQGLCYWIRTMPSSWDDETETGVKYTQEQWQSLKRIQGYVENGQTRSPSTHGSYRAQRQIIGDVEGNQGLEGQAWSSGDSSDSEDSSSDDCSRGESYEASEASEGKVDPRLINEVMNLSQLMLIQDTSQISLYESPLMHYLAVRGIDVEAEAFRPSFWYTSILAGVLWMARLIMLEVAVPLEAWPTLGLEGKATIPSIPQRVRTIREKHLVEGSYSAVSSILAQLAMGKKYNRTHESPSNIHWSEDSQTIHYGGMPIPLAKVRTMGQQMVAQLGAMLQKLAFGIVLPTFPLGQLVDSMAWSSEFRRTDYSFIDHSKNPPEIQVGYRFLFQEAQKPNPIWKLFYTSSDSYEARWRSRVKQQYLVAEKRFLQALMVVFHIQGGQPARGPELGSVKASNSIYSAWNIYIINGRVCFITTYDKAQKRRGNSEYVVRCLPDAVSQLVVQYLVFVRPFARVLDQRESEWLFGDDQGPWAGEQLTRALAQATTKHLGVRLTVAGWRHVAIGIAVRQLTTASKTWDVEGEGAAEDEEFAGGGDALEVEENTLDHIIVRQASHGRRVAQAHYAIDGAFLHRLGPQLISAFEQASIAWHKLFEWPSIGAGCTKVKEEPPSAGFSFLGPGPGNRPVSELEPHTAGSPFLGPGPGNPSPTSRRGHARQASQVLEPDSHKRGRFERTTLVRGPEQAQEGLRRIYGPQAQFQSEGQASAMALVHDPPPTSIIVLPTSSGKSVLFFSVAAMVVRQTVVVVVPFAALVEDVLQRAQEHGLNSEEWLNSQSGYEERQLVVVSADRAICPEFLHWAKGLELEGRLAHVFFDEGHVAFTDTSYRERLRELWKLRYLECPFTVLTATLMVELEDKLRTLLLIPDATLFRRPTVRPTIRYQVVDSGQEAPSMVGLRTIQALGKLASGQRGVVYVRSYATGDFVREKLGCPFYKAHADQKSQVLAAWTQGPGGWIVATGALGTGVNIGGIRYVVHIDRPYGLTSFVQQSGRGGRGGEVSESIIVVGVERSQSRRRPGIMSADSTEQVDEEAMTEFVRSPGCRRQVLARWLDGQPEAAVDCHQGGWVLCDRCSVRRRPSSPPVTDRRRRSGLELIVEQSYEMMQEEEQMLEIMGQFQRGCIYCALVYGIIELGQPHSYDTCPTADIPLYDSVEYQQWRRTIVFEKQNDCWGCGLSQRICRSQVEGGGCEYPHVVFPGVFILAQKQYLAAVVEAVGFQGSYEEDVWDWLKEEEEGAGGQWESNWMRTWRMICQLYQQMSREAKSRVI